MVYNCLPRVFVCLDYGNQTETTRDGVLIGYEGGARMRNAVASSILESQRGKYSYVFVPSAVCLRCLRIMSEANVRSCL